MGELTLRPSSECQFDIAVLGEVMLRFDPGTHRIRNARQFTVTEGGGEYNVGRSLRKVFSWRSALVTAIGTNEIGWLLEDLLLQGGMNLDHVVWKATDDRGRWNRNAVYFAEQGFGIRTPKAVYDRASSAASTLSPGDIDWDHLFGDIGVRWFHTGGIFAGLSDSCRDICQEAMDAARRHGTAVSFDVNYRPKLWSDAGGADASRLQAEQFAASADVLFGVADIDAVAGGPSEGTPAPTVIANLLRTTHSASAHDLRARAWSHASGFIDSVSLMDIAVLDRIGSGDSFAAGVIATLADGHDLAHALDVGVAHAAVTMTTPGDTSSSDPEEINSLIYGSSKEIGR